MNKRPITILSKTHHNGDEKIVYAVHFAFELSMIICPKTNDKQAIFNKRAFKWHHSLLCCLAHNNSNLYLRFRYIKEKSNIKVFCLVSIIANTKKKCQDKYQKFFNELTMQFELAPDSETSLYHFNPVMDIRQLIQILVPFKQNKKIVFSRKAAILKQLEIGFVADISAGDKNTNKNMKVNFPLLYEHFPDLIDIVKILQYQSAATMFEIIIHPHKVNKLEQNLLESYHINGTYKEYYQYIQEGKLLNQFISKLLHQSEYCFKIKIQIVSSKNYVPSNLISTIYHGLFNRNANISFIDSRNGEDEYKINDFNLEELDVAWRIPEIDDIYLIEESPFIFRLPSPTVQGLPGVKKSSEENEYCPDNISVNGAILGKKNNSNTEQLIRIDRKDLRRHVYILGQTGTGKTTLLYSMIMERINAGNGVGIIDPHGDLALKIYRHIPKNRKKDIIIFDPTKKSKQLALNMLEYDKDFPEQKTFIIHELFDIFNELYHSETMGPMFEFYMRNAMLLVMDNSENQGNLPDIIKVFSDSKYREYLLNKCGDKSVVQFWKDIASAANYELSIRNITPYIVSKLNKFVQNHYVYPIINRRKSSFNFRDIIDSGCIIIARIPKGSIGNQGVKLIGSILFNKIFMAALSRENIDENKRNDFCLFIDEFQNFTSASIASMLSEARKYRLNLILANQALGQLRSEILHSVLGNVGSLVFFRPGIEDAERIEKYTSPNFKKEDMINLPNYTTIARLQNEEMPTKPFVFHTMPEREIKKIFLQRNTSNE